MSKPLKNHLSFVSSERVHHLYQAGQGKLYFIPNDFEPVLCSTNPVAVKNILRVTNDGSEPGSETLPNTNIFIPTLLFKDTTIFEKKEKRIPRPKNCFIIYRLHKLEMVLQNNPGINNCQASKIIGIMWHRESPQVKTYYENLYAVELQNHRRRFPEYKYTPRKKHPRKNER